MTQPPLRDDEIRVLRGMIDEYRYRTDRRRYLRSFWTTGRIVAAGLLAVGLFLLQAVATIYTIRGK